MERHRRLAEHTNPTLSGQHLQYGLLAPLDSLTTKPGSIAGRGRVVLISARRAGSRPDCQFGTAFTPVAPDVAGLSRLRHRRPLRRHLLRAQRSSA